MKACDIDKVDWIENPVWIKYECDKGNRWTAVKNGIVHEPDGLLCCFVGCTPDCVSHIRGETSSRDEANGWFKNVNEEKRL